MKTTKQVATITLIVLLGVIGYGFFRTSESTSALPTPSADRQSQAQGSVVDQASLYTARHFAQMPTSTDELPVAKEALRLGDREMDLAFAAEVRELQVHPPILSSQAKESQTRLQAAQNSLDRDNARVAELTSALTKTTGARADSLGDQLQQAKVQVELDQDEVDNAKQGLVLAGGDTEGRIEELMKEHEAASQVADSTMVNTATSPMSPGLIHHYQEWSRLHDKALELRLASRDAESADRQRCGEGPPAPTRSAPIRSPRGDAAKRGQRPRTGDRGSCAPAAPPR